MSSTWQQKFFKTAITKTNTQLKRPQTMLFINYYYPECDEFAFVSNYKDYSYFKSFAMLKFNYCPTNLNTFLIQLLTHFKPHLLLTHKCPKLTFIIKNIKLMVSVTN